MDKAVYNHIVKVLKDYPDIESYIRAREDELMYPHVQADDNIGGGKGNVMTSQFGDYGANGDANGRPSVTSSNEVMAITIADDRRLTNLQREHDIVQRCLDESDDETVTIISELYIRARPVLTVDGVANKVHLSTSQVRRRRADFFERVRERLGW